MTEQEEREKMAKEIGDALLHYKTNIMKNAEAIEKRFLKLSIDPCHTFHEKTNRYRGAFDIVEIMYHYGLISYSLCVELEKRINYNNAREILKD